MHVSQSTQHKVTSCFLFNPYNLLILTAKVQGYVLLLDFSSFCFVYSWQFTLITLITKPFHSCLLLHYTSKKLTKHVERGGNVIGRQKRAEEMSVGGTVRGGYPGRNVRLPLHPVSPTSVCSVRVRGFHFEC